MAEEEDTQGNHVGDKGEEEESAWERSSSVCVPWGQSLRGKAYNGMR